MRSADELTIPRPAAAPGPPAPGEERVGHQDEVRLCTGRLVAVLVGAVVVLGTAGGLAAALRLWGYPTALGFVDLFDVEFETNVTAWFSSLLLCACAALLALLARIGRDRWDRRARSWALLSVVFVALSADEAVAYHEHWIDRLRTAFDAGGLLYFTWVVPAGILVALLAASQVPFLRSLPRATARRIVVAGALYVGGALGLEMVNGWYVDTVGGGDAAYATLVVLEEVLEMAGAVAFLRALLLHLGTVVGEVRFSCGPGVAG